MMTTSSKHLSKILIVILGVMTAFGPLTIDMYGPSLPKVQHAFGSSISEIQLTLSFCYDRFSYWSICIRATIRCIRS